MGLPVPKSGLRVLLYHSVGTRLDHDPYGLSMDPKLFEEQLRLLRDIPCQVVPLKVPSPESTVCQVCVTFDDGYKDNLGTAAPILARLAVPFTVFVTPAFVRSGKPEYLSPAELKELLTVPGCSVGSHGMTHKPLGKLSPGESLSELADSRKWLEDLLGRAVRAVSYPHGSASADVRQQAAQSGYDLGLCSRTDVNPAGRDPLMLCRTEIIDGDSPRAFEQKIYGAWDWHRFRHPDPLNL